MAPPQRELHETVYSNIDHDLDDNVVGELEKGDCFARHAAWDFNGSIWFDVATATWYEDIWRYKMHTDQFTAATIMGVIEQANDEYGSR
jgi:hypothetical protein